MRSSIKLRVISRPSLDEKSLDLFLSDHATTWSRNKKKQSNAELITEFAGRICYFSFGKRQSPRNTKEYILNLIDNGHESVFEHVTWVFVCYGITRAFSHQLVRHRVGFGYSQLSQQYFDHSEANFVIPSELVQDAQLIQAWKQHNQLTKELYSRIVSSEKNRGGELGKKEQNRFIRSLARTVLPNNTETKIVFSANARALRHFLSVRGSTPGDIEMRNFCVALLETMKKEAPELFQDFEIAKYKDGKRIVKNSG